MKYLSSILVIVPILILSTSGGKMPTKSVYPTAGTYNSPYIKFRSFQLIIDQKGNGSFRTIFSRSTPPAILDEKNFKAEVRRNGTFCITPKPLHYPACFQVISDSKLRAVDDKGNQVFVMNIWVDNDS